MRWRFRRQPPSRFWITGALSLVFHALGALGIARMPGPDLPDKPDKVLKIQVLAIGEPADEPEPPTPAEEPPAVAEAVVAPAPRPAPPTPPVSAPPSPAPSPVALPTPSPRPAPPTSFSSWRNQRFAPYLPSRFPTRGAGGTDAASSEGRDHCDPAPGRQIDRLYLLYDSSGSMSGALQGQALRCAQQYAKAAIDGGADVVVGNFAGTTVLAPPTRSMTDVSFALRAPNDHTRTFLPSTELYRTFDAAPGAAADLVILSDGHIPNYREVMASYRYFLEINPDNRGYLYTLGVRGHPAVTSALRDIGFDIYVYRLF